MTDSEKKLKSEITALRKIVSAHTLEIEDLKGRIDICEDALASIGIFVEEGENSTDPSATFREQQLELLAEMMKLHPDYFDIDQVLTEEAVENEILRIASDYTDENGGDPMENEEIVRRSIWKMPNPYRYLYDMIKQIASDEDVSMEGISRTEH